MHLIQERINKIEEFKVKLEERAREEGEDEE